MMMYEFDSIASNSDFDSLKKIVLESRNNPDKFETPSHMMLSCIKYDYLNGLKYILSKHKKRLMFTILTVNITNTDIEHILLFECIRLNSINCLKYLTSLVDSYCENIHLFSLAASTGNFTVLNILLNSSIIKGTEDHAIALLEAIHHKNINSVRFLLCKDADPKFNNNESIMTAAAIGDIEILNLLVSYGADPLADDCNAVIIASKNKNIDFLETLITIHGADINAHNALAFKEAVKNNDNEIINVLIRCGIDVFLCDENLLLTAIKNNNNYLTKFLLSISYDISKNNYEVIIETYKMMKYKILKYMLCFIKNKDISKIIKEMRLIRNEYGDTRKYKKFYHINEEWVKSLY